MASDLEQFDHDYKGVAEFYDDIEFYQQRVDINFYVEEAQQRTDGAGPVLEIGCGTGRILIPTAQSGIAITGVDPSKYMLDVCRNKISQEPVDVQRRTTLITGDMRELNIGKRFPVVTMPFRPFQLMLTIEDQLRALDRVAHHLEPDGRFIFDCFNPWLKFLADDTNMVRRPDGDPIHKADGRVIRRFIRILQRDLHKQLQLVEMSYDVAHTDGRQETLYDRFWIRYSFRYELEHLLALAGFETEHLYNDFNRSPWGAVDPGEIIIVARRTSNDV